jgi:hypothetical protein
VTGAESRKHWHHDSHTKRFGDGHPHPSGRFVIISRYKSFDFLGGVLHGLASGEDRSAGIRECEAVASASDQPGAELFLEEFDTPTHPHVTNTKQPRRAQEASGMSGSKKEAEIVPLPGVCHDVHLRTADVRQQI